MTSPTHDAERGEWRHAVDDLTTAEHAPYDDRQTYDDTMAPDGTRYGER